MNGGENDPLPGHWIALAERLDWVRAPTAIKDVSFDRSDCHIAWYPDGLLNVSANCLDRHLTRRGDACALIWESDEPGTTATFTYRELHAEVCRMANVLRSRGVGKGDRVTIYLPMIPEAVFAMLACARIGAVHAVVFGGFSPDSLAQRIQDCGSRLVVTADESVRGGRHFPLKNHLDTALRCCSGVTDVLVVARTGVEVAMKAGRDHRYEELRSHADTICPAEVMEAEDPLFILYTSGSTGQPKGVLHTCGGYLAWASYTHEHVFGCDAGDIFWCTADIGWITGHSYVVYGPLANGTASVLFEGVPTYPDPSRMWETVDKHGVTVLYTAPTAIRALIREGEAAVERTSRRSLRLLGTVGEPIDPESWRWFDRVVGEGRCPIVDTWWQTETGGILMSPDRQASLPKPGSCGTPLPGVRCELLDADGNVLDGEASGSLCLADSWPGQMRSIYGDHDRFIDTYFSTFPGKYFTGDGARRDADGSYWITGRVDDVVNVSGHRIGSAEVEAALLSHGDVAEVAVTGFPHAVKGQGLHCFVVLKNGASPADDLVPALTRLVRERIGPFAAPDTIQIASGLPKTRSGKIMRRILRKIVEGSSELGDLSTLAEPAVVDRLIAGLPPTDPRLAQVVRPSQSQAG